MRIDGKKIRDEIKEELRKELLSSLNSPTIAIISVGNNPVIQQFVNIKKRFAHEIGVEVIVLELPSESTFEGIKNIIQKHNDDPLVKGIVVQLPLPRHLDTSSVLNCIAQSKDVDVLAESSLARFKNNDLPILPPVIGAVSELCERFNIQIINKNILVVGSGRLVGAPGATWFRQQGGNVTVVDNPSEDILTCASQADIILSGAGSAGLLKKEMLKQGVVLFDAGTSESEGVVLGDADPSCEEVSEIFTPVPGGIGPITVAMIFKNLTILNKKNS